MFYPLDSLSALPECSCATNGSARTPPSNTLKSCYFMTIPMQPCEDLLLAHSLLPFTKSRSARKPT